jgi:phosphatidylglycerol:prolipoprotein diacylglycerol transferase
MSYFEILRSGNPLLHRTFIFLAFIVGSTFIFKKSRTWKLDWSHRTLVLSSASIGSIFGAIIPGYFAGDLIGHSTKDDFLENYLYGPKTILGGLLLGFFFVAVIKKVFKIKQETSDDFVLGTCALMFIGRIGCYFQHCCYGIIVPSYLGIDFGDGHFRLPVQLIEAAYVGILFLLIRKLENENRFQNKRFFIFFVAYGIGRFVLEFFRENLAIAFLSLGFYQWLAVGIVGVGVFHLLKGRIPNLNDSVDIGDVLHEEGMKSEKI